jgi:hypothetical protein
MSRSIAAALGVVLALGGFALGRYMAAEPRERGRSARAAAGAAGGAISEALQEGDPFARAARLASLLESLGPEAAPEARAILTGPQFDYGVAELELLVRFWAQHEAKAAADWAFSTAPGGCPLAVVSPAVEAWARLDPRAVAAAIRSTPWLRGPEGQPAELAILRGWFASSQPGLDEYIRDMGIGFGRQRAVAQFAALMIGRDGPEAVQRWAEGLPDQDERFKLEAFGQVAAELAKVAPEAAVAWCDEHCEGPYGTNVRTQVAIQWAARDGKATMEWLAGEPEGRERDVAVGTAYGAWLRRDSEAATAWMAEKGTHGIEPWLLPAVGRYALTIVPEDPIGAIEWAALIPDEDKRELAYIAIFRHWRYRDEAAAEAWLAQSPLSEEARERARIRAPHELPSLKPAQPPS